MRVTKESTPSKDEALSLVTLPHPLFNSIVAEVVRWNDTIRNAGVQLPPVEAV